MLNASSGTQGTANRWQATGASIRGLAHIKRNQPCQDSHVWREIAGGAMLIAVADGAGSASLSQLGSARAALAAADWVTELLKGEWPTTEEEWKALLLAALETAHESVNAAAKRRHVTPRELATTLILVVVTPELAAAVQVGDGAAVLRGADGALFPLTAPQSGEYINETVFFTSPEYLDVVQFGFWRGPVTGVAAFSDGLQLLALRMPGGNPHPAFFTPLFQMMSDEADPHKVEERLRAFLQSDRIRERADDDLTLVLGTRHQP